MLSLQWWLLRPPICARKQHTVYATLMVLAACFVAQSGGFGLLQLVISTFLTLLKGSLPLTSVFWKATASSKLCYKTEVLCLCFYAIYLGKIHWLRQQRGVNITSREMDAKRPRGMNINCPRKPWSVNSNTLEGRIEYQDGITFEKGWLVTSYIDAHV